VPPRKFLCGNGAAQGQPPAGEDRSGPDVQGAEGGGEGLGEVPSAGEGLQSKRGPACRAGDQPRKRRIYSCGPPETIAHLLVAEVLLRKARKGEELVRRGAPLGQETDQEGAGERQGNEGPSPTVSFCRAASGTA
jgi:hypothetical protein